MCAFPNYLGLPYANHVPYVLQQTDDDIDLVTMMTVAINSLKKGPDGFALFVEGARIDHGHHSNHAQ